jgi:hypothetical protein
MAQLTPREAAAQEARVINSLRFQGFQVGGRHCHSPGR